MKTVAVIGCGGIGSYHLRHFLQYDNIELVGFCDLILERAEAFCEKAGVGRAYTDYVEMLDTEKPDMVFVCVPPTCHGQIEMDLIERGIHMYVEKPVSLDLSLAKKIRDAAEAKGIITASGFQCRYDNINEATKEFIETHEVVYIDCVRMGDMPEVWWWRDKKLSGGQIVEQTVHQFDILRYVFGEPDTVFTMGTRGFVRGVENYDTDDLTTTVVRFKNGTLATISTGCYAKAGEAFDSKITFSAKDARLDYYLLTKACIYDANAKKDEEEAEDGKTVIKGDGGLAASAAECETILHENGDTGLIADRTFIEAVYTGDTSKIRSSYRDACRSLAFVLACNESMETGLPVKIEID